MRPEQREELTARFGDHVAFDVPLAKLSTYRIGGPAAAILEPASVTHVADAVETAGALGISWMVLGLGSNVLMPDEGVDGLVIRLGKRMAESSVEASGATWTVGAGLPTPLLARRTAAAGVAGVHRLIGVPGSVGGGVFMNAGAHGQEFADVVRWVDVVGRDGTVSRLSGDRIAWAYRSSGLDSVVVATQLELVPADPLVLRREVSRHLKWRKAGTPFDQPCCGSVFRNPSAETLSPRALGIPGPYSAGRFIDMAGLKGYRVGDAEVSPMHANYIVNRGAATAADVQSVIAGVRERVYDRFDIELLLEARLIDADGNTKSHD